jgi:hypothetical protein
VLAELRAKRDACLQTPLQRMSEHEQILHLALRRGPLLVEAQLKWLAETRARLASPRRARQLGDARALAVSNLWRVLRI